MIKQIYILQLYIVGNDKDHIGTVKKLIKKNSFILSNLHSILDMLDS